jgi:hypothetical protein
MKTKGIMHTIMHTIRHTIHTKSTMKAISTTNAANTDRTRSSTMSTGPQ